MGWARPAHLWSDHDLAVAELRCDRPDPIFGAALMIGVAKMALACSIDRPLGHHEPCDTGSLCAVRLLRIGQEPCEEVRLNSPSCGRVERRGPNKKRKVVFLLAECSPRFMESGCRYVLIIAGST